MRTDVLKFVIALAAACAASALPGVTAVQAQAPPGPMTPTQPTDSRGAAPAAAPAKPPVQPRTAIFGAWQLNPEESDDPRKRAQESRSGGYGGNRRMGGGYPGGGYGGRRMGGGGQGMSDDERQKMQELMNPPHRLTLAEAKKDVEVDAFDEEERKRAFFTDGRKLQKSKDANYQEIAAKWDGPRLVTDEKNPRGGKMSRTYELSYDGTQLYETLHMTVGRNNTPLVIRFVYEQAPGSTTTAPPPGSAQPQH
jgi:hypothetical protein